jgi:hypothetical protein
MMVDYKKFHQWENKSHNNEWINNKVKELINILIRNDFKDEPIEYQDGNVFIRVSLYPETDDNNDCYVDVVVSERYKTDLINVGNIFDEE